MRQYIIGDIKQKYLLRTNRRWTKWSLTVRRARRAGPQEEDSTEHDQAAEKRVEEDLHGGPVASCLLPGAVAAPRSSAAPPAGVAGSI